MSDTPMIIVNGVTEDPTPILDDAFSKGYAKPTPNLENLYTLVSTKTTDTGFELVIRRPIKIIRDGRDESLALNIDIDMIYAFREEAFTYHTRPQRGFFKMLLDPQTGKVHFDGVIDDTQIFYKIHGIVLYCTWSIVSFLVIVSGRYMRHLFKFRMIIHASMGVLLTTNTVIIVLLSLTEYSTPSSPKYSHKALGIFVMVMSILQMFGGMTVKQVQRSISWKSKVAGVSKLGHKILGFCLIVIANAQVVTGLYNYESPVKNLIFLHFVIYILMLVAIEVLYRYRFQYKEKGVVKKKGIPEYTPHEFAEMIRKGSELVLFNNYILDIEGFKDEHPGTAFVLKENIGNEIGKYFYGAYSMEQDVAAYVHSKYAASLLEKLAIGKLLQSNSQKSKGNSRMSINSEGDNFISCKPTSSLGIIV
jgi:hypothetical protein